MGLVPPLLLMFAHPPLVAFALFQVYAVLASLKIWTASWRIEQLGFCCWRPAESKEKIKEKASYLQNNNLINKYISSFSLNPAKEK